MKKDKQPKKSPLLDLYIQKQNQESRFDQVDEEEIAKAIRTLLDQEESTSKDLN